MGEARGAGARGRADAADEGKANQEADFIQLRNVVKKFGDAVAVDRVSLSIRRREIFALLGSSGCGKSTLLRMLAGFETPTAGQVLIDGEDVTAMPPYRRPVNMMFQSYALFPHMTVEGNVGYGLRQEGVRGSELRDRVAGALELVQMGRFATRRPHQLSGGQQQRVALARSLVKRPKLLLLDEPMSALDKQIRQRTQIELINILETVGVTCIMVTHDQEEAMTMADRVAVMSEGEIVQVGKPTDVYEVPNSRFSAQFIGTTNLFEGEWIATEADHARIDAPELVRPLYIRHGGAPAGASGTSVAVSIRPERVRLSRGQPTAACNWSAGVVAQTAYLGAYTICHVTLPSGRVLLANVPSLGLNRIGMPEIGETVFVSWDADDGVVLTS
ncbi:polyamine ABC transporter ATP-binding protein [Robbsia sp. Bb-Pol-6]|uniref:Spermidine/putrescine import ATP-binding protein PotA n=1 Tax=Robbsia betulipollinis TaxID=2981849 RepID=A0ABT3ZQJ4_9BURK|nr:polyamine ABC transporter ATP-binding protein [Robbsia betulipollinis]MCY0388158.1 polyamine ABC transporter ATP-binding protein [Robbsia betulipollinis]